MNINDDEILNIEFYHDNKDNIKLIDKCKYFYDTINTKTLILSTKFKNKKINGSNAENLIKELLFENIVYKNIKLTNYVNYDSSLNFDNNIFIFDNIALGDYGIKIINSLFNIQNKKLNVFIPFIYICESTINNEDTITTKINELNNYKKNHNIKVHIENFVSSIICF